MNPQSLQPFTFRNSQMRLFLTALLSLTGLALSQVPTTAQEVEGCFMVDRLGNLVSLSRLCGGASEVSPRTNSRVFQVPIKRRQGGTPIIDVTFNGQKTFEMFLDTGASQTTITPQMADALRFVPTGTERARVASGDVIEFPMGRIASIAVGGAVVNNPLVSVGAVPLLGQNFLGGYDITIKQNVVEFHVR